LFEFGHKGMSGVNPITKKSRRLSRGFSNAIVPLTKKKSTKDLSTGKTPPDGGGEKGQSSPPLKGNLIKHKMAKDFEVPSPLPSSPFSR